MDTVIIKIQGPQKFQMTDLAKSWFLPELTRRHFHQLSKTEQQSTQLYLRHFVLKPPFADAYLPKIEVFETLNKTRDDVRYVLKMAFSVPKLLYGSSLQEASGHDFERVLYALEKALSGVGVTIENSALINASVSAVDFCKNIPLPPEIRMQEILAELLLVDINKVVDVTLKEEKNGGRWLHVYSGTIERVFYDKIADAMRPKVKRKDKGRMARERATIEHYKLTNCEVFRYEYRIKKGQTVKREINAALGREPKTPVGFKDLFAPNLCKTIVLKSWRGLIQRPENQLALLAPIEGLGLLDHIIAEALKHSGAHSINKALASYGLACAIRDRGAKEVRRVVSVGRNKDHPERLTRKIEAAAALTRGLPYSNGIAFVDAALEQHELITKELLERTGNK
ncbi:MAG: hypothetical protein WCI89_03390 [bacterium]